MTLRVGLTGGIGSGKSLVSGLFAELGVTVIDTDVIAREVVAPGTPLLAKLATEFGKTILTLSGELDRKRLRELIFADAAARHRLEALLHPAIRGEMEQRLRACSQPYAIVVIPLLLEAGWEDAVDRILVVDAPESLQIERAVTRDGISVQQVEAIMATQTSRQARLEAADDVICNDDGIAPVRTRILELDRIYNALGAES